MMEVPALAKVACDFFPAVRSRWSFKYVILKFHDNSVTYFGDKQAYGVMRNAKVEG